MVSHGNQFHEAKFAGNWLTGLLESKITCETRERNLSLINPNRPKYVQYAN